MKNILLFEENMYYEIPCHSDFVMEGLEVLVSDTVTVNNKELSANKLNTIQDKKIMLLESDYKKVFERESYLEISDVGDLTIKDFKHKVIIDDMKIIFEDDSFSYYLNGVKTTNTKLEEGDIVQIDNVRIIVYKNLVSLFLCEDDYETTLLEVYDIENVFEGFPFYRRSPRIIKREVEDEITILDPPMEAKLEVKGIIGTFLPTVIMSGISVGIGVMMGRGIMLISSIAGSVMTLITGISKFFSDRKENAIINQKRMDIYNAYMLDVRKRVYIDYETSKEAMQYNHPDLYEISELIETHSSRLYERSRQDDDFLEICIGTVSEKSPFDIQVNFDEMSLDQDDLNLEAKQLADEYSRMDNVPIRIDLKEAHLGLVGEKKSIHKHLKDYIFQLTFFQSYRDLEIIHIYNEEYEDDFSYLKWYPHFKVHAINAYGTIFNERIRDQVLSSVYQILKDRKQKSEEEGEKEYIYSPYYLFIIDDAQMVLNHSIMEFLQLEMNEFDYSIIYTTNKKSKLPENIKSVIFLNDDEEITLLIEMENLRIRE